MSIIGDKFCSRCGSENRIITLFTSKEYGGCLVCPNQLGSEWVDETVFCEGDSYPEMIGKLQEMIDEDTFSYFENQYSRLVSKKEHHIFFEQEIFLFLQQIAPEGCIFKINDDNDWGFVGGIKTFTINFSYVEYHSGSREIEAKDEDEARDLFYEDGDYYEYAECCDTGEVEIDEIAEN